MRVVVLGASGRTGAEVIDLALSRGHEVVAFGRSPDKIRRRHERLRVVHGDPRSAAEIAAALRPDDVVISALGPRRLFERTTLLEDCATSTVDAMKRVGTRRLLVVSQALHFPIRAPHYVLARWVLRRPLRDSAGMERVVRASDLEWTIARPPRLVRASDERYRSADGAMPRRGVIISWRAVAAFLLDDAATGGHARRVVGLAR